MFLLMMRVILNMVNTFYFYFYFKILVGKTIASPNLFSFFLYKSGLGMSPFFIALSLVYIAYVSITCSLFSFTVHYIECAMVVAFLCQGFYQNDSNDLHDPS